MHFEQILAGVDETGRGTVTSDWEQGRTIFGGLTAALLYEALRRRQPEGRQLRSLTTHFIAPPRAHVPFELTVLSFKAGRNVSMAQSRMVQDGEVKATAIGCFGSARPSGLRIPPAKGPDLPGPETGKPAFLDPAIIPNFMRHIEFRWVAGDQPFRAGASREIAGWARLREPPERMTEAHLMALIDAWPPVCLSALERPALVSTLTWTLDLVGPVTASPTSWWLYSAEVTQAADGYSQATAGVWDQSGTLVARSHQTVAVYDRPR